MRSGQLQIDDDRVRGFWRKHIDLIQWDRQTAPVSLEHRFFPGPKPRKASGPLCAAGLFNEGDFVCAKIPFDGDRTFRGFQHFHIHSDRVFTRHKGKN